MSHYSIGAFDILMAAHDPLVDEYVDGVLQLQDRQIAALPHINSLWMMVIRR